MGIEEAGFTATKTEGDFQVRHYTPQVVAEIQVEGSLEDAGNQAFRPLFDYISGANRAKDKIVMTAPVTQQREGEKIAMTAPVGQEASGKGWRVSFRMPAHFTLDTLPEPLNEKIHLRAIPARSMATVRYSGTWSQARYERHLARLREWMKTKGWVATGDPVWARYNPPFTPWFLRRNEVLIPAKEL